MDVLFHRCATTSWEVRILSGERPTIMHQLEYTLMDTWYSKMLFCCNQFYGADMCICGVCGCLAVFMWLCVYMSVCGCGYMCMYVAVCMWYMYVCGCVCLAVVICCCSRVAVCMWCVYV